MDHEGFVQLRPQLRAQFHKKNTVYVGKNYIAINALAYEELGQPSDLRIAVNPARGQIMLTSNGPFAVSTRISAKGVTNRKIYNADFRIMPNGPYAPTGTPGLYQYVENLDKVQK